MTFSYLTSADLREVHQALINGDLASHSSLEAMLQPLNRHFVGSISSNSKSNLYLWNILNAITREHNLRNGDVPAEQFLSSALAMAGPSQAATVLEAKLEKVTYAQPAENLPSATASTLPQTDAEVTPEAQTNAYDQTVGVSFLSEGVIAARSVVKILIQRHFDGVAEVLGNGTPALVNGTAWFITRNLLITNHHVVNARRKVGVAEPDASEADFALQADSAMVLFDYLDKNEEPAARALGASCLVHSNPALDFALLRVPDELAQREPLRLRQFLMQKTPEQAMGSRVNLLQHPNGKPMRLGFRNNYIVKGDANSLAYLTDTEVGSSGSPVCDDTWSVAALHAGSRGISDRSIEILGHKFMRENYGIPMHAIMAHLEQEQPAIHQEVTASQPQ